MFTVGAFLVLCLIAWRVDRRQYADSDDSQENIKHSRQDLRLIAYLLFAVVILLGIIADRLH